MNWRSVGAGINIQLALFREQQGRQAGEVLAGGADAHAGGERIGNAMLDAGEAEGTLVKRFAMPRHAHHYAGCITAVHWLEQCVQRFGKGCVHIVSC